MLIAISGSQGSGKTSILHKLEERGFNTIKRKTSRSILADWNVTLNQVNTDPELTLRFQSELINRKYADEQEARNSDEIWFTERSYVDLIAYSTVALGHQNEHSDWLDQYVEQCIQKHQGYDFVFYLKAGHFKVQGDGVRGENRYYSLLVDLFMEKMLYQVTLPNRLLQIDTPILEHRVKLIEALVACQ